TSLSACACLLIIFSQKSSYAPSNVQTLPRLSATAVEKWRSYLRYMAEEMPKRHKNLFHTMTREQFNTAVKELDERIPKLSRHEIIVGLARIVAMVGDGHTGIQSFLYNPKVGFRYYPFGLYLFKDSLFVY